MMQIVNFQNWSIEIISEQFGYDCGQSRYRAIALLSLAGAGRNHETEWSVCCSRVIRLTGPICNTAAEENSAILDAAKREIESIERSPTWPDMADAMVKRNVHAAPLLDHWANTTLLL